MILKETIVKVSDNSGARLGKCIQVIGKPYAFDGDSIILSVKRAYFKKKAQKGKVYKAIVIQSKKVKKRLFGYFIFFNSNRVVLLKRVDEKKFDFVPLGSRIFYKVSFSLRLKGYLKLLLISFGQI